MKKMKLKLKKGALRQDLGVPQGEPIPEKKLAAAKQSNDPLERKRATFAENAKGWNHNGKKRMHLKPRKGMPVYMTE